MAYQQLFNTEEIQHKIQQMTLEEKASLMSGGNFWNTKAIERLGIPSIMLTDGPHGLRKQGGKADHVGLNKSLPATCFPTAATLANSWDTKLLNEVGHCLGREAAYQNVQVLLGPGLNIKRNPLCGRNFEYFSEDPYLSGKLAAAMVRGIQDEGVAACPKHFAVNSQETHRMCVNEVVDERALHELYLEGFRIVVEESQPQTLMTSYNKVNGIYANENPYLIENVLRNRWGFEGVVVSDWGGNNDRVAALKVGSTLEMPSTNGMTDKEIVDAIKKGDLSEVVLDGQVTKLLTLIAKTHKSEDEKPYKRNHHKAIEAACRSMVLLKNDQQILPIRDLSLKIGMIGDFANKPRYQGAGSSLIEPTRLVSLNEAMVKQGFNVIGYEQGFKRYGQPSQRLKEKAIQLAIKSDIVLVFLGLDEGTETEGVDRAHMRLAQNQLRLVEDLSRVNENIVVILAGGAPVELPFIDKVKGILHGYLPGQGGGQAIALTLKGENNPSGKLAESYPLHYEDVASSSNYPGRGYISEHQESIYIGYRQYDHQKLELRFPFGYGLSYTTFHYDRLEVQENHVRVWLTNTGDCFGEEIIQVYIAAQNSRVFREKQSLKGFAKVGLDSKESKVVDILLDKHAFSYYNIKEKRWVVESGHYDILVGASSRDIRLKDTLMVVGESLDNPYGFDNYDYLTGKDFKQLLHLQGQRRVRPERHGKKKIVLNEHNLMEDTKYSGWFGRFVYGSIMFLHHLYKLLGKPIASNNVLFILSIPIRSMARMSGGRIDMHRLEGIIKMLNGKFIRGLIHAIKAR